MASPIEEGLGLRTRELAHAFRDTTSSYKFFWFLAIVDLLPAFDRPVPMERIVQAMIIRAWAAVVVFRLSLGGTDRLQKCVRDLQISSGLPARTSEDQLGREMTAWPAMAKWVDDLTRFVPGRFLSSWFADIALKEPYDRRGALGVAVAADAAWDTPESGPYRLVQREGQASVELAPAWRTWLHANRALVLGFTEQRLTRYLQVCNPSTPAIVHKLEMPRRRSLARARLWWAWILADTRIKPVHDIFTDEPLGASYQLDHFLPWSFVAHDEFWNLCPVMPAINRDKADHLPALDAYLPRLVALHGKILTCSDLPAGLARTYGEFLGINPRHLGQLEEDRITQRYNEVVRPLAQIAANQGFPSDWRPRVAAG